MNDFMMALGPFLFSVDTANYDRLQRSAKYNWASKDRITYSGKGTQMVGGPSLQYMGPGEETMQLNGTFYPQYRGLRVAPSLLRLIASLGYPMPIVSMPKGSDKLGDRSDSPFSIGGSSVGSIAGGLSGVGSLASSLSLPSFPGASALTGLVGQPLGFWVIKSLEETNSEYEKWGKARKIEYNLSLQRYIPDSKLGLLNALSI